MCVEAIAIAATVASTALGVVGSIQEGRAAKSAAEYQQKIAARNQEIALRNAADSRARGDKAMMDKGLETRAMLGRQRAILADRNISGASGTALEVLGDTAQFGKLDALTIRQNFEREAISYETQAGNFSAEGQLAGMSAKNAGISGTLGAISQGISGVSSLANFASNRKLQVR